MSLVRTLNFQPLPLRPGIWFAEITNLRYTIFQSNSGFVVDCQRLSPGSTGNTPVGGAPRGLHASYQVAVEACNAHLQSYTP